MNRLQVLKSALVGGASILTVTGPSAAKVFDIPDGDLSTALVAYMKQSDVELVYANNVVRGHKSRGIKGDYTETAALTQLLRGTGFTTQSVSSSAIGIVPEPHDAAPIKVAQAVRARATAPASIAPQDLETVIVTAQKKGENIQQVPIAVSAFTQQQLTERQVAGGPDLIREVPNMTFSKTNFTGYNIEIRGIGTQAISVTADPAVAVAFNDIPFIRNHFFEQEFYDLSDAEVLRGPQGTLYGRNATAGVVNIKSALPIDQYEAMLSADLGNYSNRRLEGMLNLPIDGDTLDLRIAGEWTKRDGYTFDETTDRRIDGRDLWSGRVTLGWKPNSDLQTYLVWERFSEDDDRLNSGKQLCEKDPGLATVTDWNGNPVSTTAASSFGQVNVREMTSQGCLPTSLYSPDAFETPNGNSIPFVIAGQIYYYGGQLTLLNGLVDPYGTVAQSPNLRVIQSELTPTYKVKNDTLEFNANYNLGSGLTLTSQTGYNSDFLASTQDFNNFNSAPGVFTNNPLITPNGVFCDPQLGCSNKLVGEDMSLEHSWQLSQEFRLVSNFTGPLNFSFGGNYLHYETDESYYVFSNLVTLITAAYDQPYNAVYPPIGTFPDSCGSGGPTPHTYRSPKALTPPIGCTYIDPNPISSLNNEGHNYFLNQNPYILNSYAAFGEVYYQLAQDLKLTAGVRWTDDQKHFTEIPSWIAIPGWGYPTAGAVDQKWSEPTGRFVADWTPNLDFTDQSLIYASYSRGYKAGGANPPPPSLAGTPPVTHPLTFNPEFINAYELGTKNTFADGELTLNADIFYYDYKGYQISEIVDRDAISLNINAHVEGAELESTWEPMPGLKFNFTGGYESTRIANGTEAVDLMDRTAGHPGWAIFKPSPTATSNCVLPDYVVAALADTVNNNAGNAGINAIEACSQAYFFHTDPVSSYYAPYAPGYPGFDPVSPTATNDGAGPAPNNGAGFYKNLGGNQLPNAPHFTTSLAAEYTMPVSADWAATLHGDFYWQSQSWARIFNDNPYDKLHGYSNVNLSLILTSANGWQVMAYVKNVFDVTAITGDFLYSDDSGLATNVFLTDPRLFGVRVTKHLDQGDGFRGSDWSGYDFFTDLFTDKDNGKPPLWIELGGGFDQLANGQSAYVPPFAATPQPFRNFSIADNEKPTQSAFELDDKITFQPDGTNWVVSAEIRYGRSKKPTHLDHAQPKVQCTYSPLYHASYCPHIYAFSNSVAQNVERHGIVDFKVGKDVGLGGIEDATSILSAGLRYVQFRSKSDSQLSSHPTVYRSNVNLFNSSLKAKRSFDGLGPSISWDASAPLMGDAASGQLSVDWGANGAVLFGRQKVNAHHVTAKTHYYYKLSVIYNHQITVARGKSVAVPNLGGFVGLSMKYDNAKVSFGYRADEFFGAMDGGVDSYKAYNRGFFGPFANISIGLGG